MSLGVQFLLATLPLFATESLGVNQSKVGYLLGAYSLAALFIRPFAGYAYDYIGRKKMYLISLGLFTLVSALYPFASTFMLLVLFRFIHGLSFGLTSTGGPTIISDVVPAARRGEGLGYFGLANTLSQALGPAIGLWIMGSSNYLELFIASGALAGFAFILVNFPKFPKQVIPTNPPSFSSFFEKRVLPISSLVLLNSVISGGVITYIIIYSKEIGIVNGGLYFFVNSFGVAVTRLFSGKIIDKSGPKLIVPFGFISMGIGYLVLSTSNGLLLFLSAALLIGIGSGTVIPALQAMVINVVEPQCRGVANSTFFAMIDIGFVIGSVLLGWMTTVMSLKSLFFISGLSYTAPLVIFLVYVLKDYHNRITAITLDQEKQNKDARDYNLPPTAVNS